ncbi:phosphatase RsbU N-terminal domain-containing protein [Bacillus sp. EB600]|uniref:phosphatase RsbU N-terminal domain-containing protein n=1 Tax=Bacillus sp. EB600 TaxID=2806345 RepID=UPI0035C05E4C|nr:hypothetical protein [Bacillus sp. EB600]
MKKHGLSSNFRIKLSGITSQLSVRSSETALYQSQRFSRKSIEHPVSPEKIVPEALAQEMVTKIYLFS